MSHPFPLDPAPGLTGGPGDSGNSGQEERVGRNAIRLGAVKAPSLVPQGWPKSAAGRRREDRKQRLGWKRQEILFPRRTR